MPVAAVAESGPRPLVTAGCGGAACMKQKIEDNSGRAPMNATFMKIFVSAALAMTIAVAVSLTPAAAGSGGGGGRGGGGGGWHAGGGHEPTPPPPSKVTGTSKPINCKAGGAGCMKQK